MQAPVSYAIYSPVLSDEVGIVKKHIVQSKQVNGVGSFASAYQKAKTPNEGFLSTYSTSIKQEIIHSLTGSFQDGMSLLAGYWLDRQEGISNCLRDDIWTLKALQEELINEVLKAAILNDTTNASILWGDYQLISKRISDGKITVNGTEIYKAGLKKTSSRTDIWFPKGGQNYYTNCPYTDFGPAFKRLKESFDNLKETFEKKDGSQALGSFSAMKEVAKQKAIRKAEQWFDKNKLSLTLGGEGGYSPRSLTNGPGLKGLVADIETELGLIKGYGELATKTYWEKVTEGSKAIEVDKYAESYRKAQTHKELVTGQMETAMKFNLSLQNVSEANLADIEDILVRTNTIIKNAYTKEVSNTNLQEFCNKLLKVVKIQCRNKTGGDVPTCN